MHHLKQILRPFEVTVQPQKNTRIRENTDQPHQSCGLLLTLEMKFERPYEMVTSYISHTI